MDERQLFEQARIYLPKYLSPEKQHELWIALKDFPVNLNYYSTEAALDKELLQGDGWRGFVMINFDTLDRKLVSGLVLSNSCDIDLRNQRALPPNLLFAPLVKLSAYVALLRANGLENPQIDDICSSIRAQKTTSIFYLPTVPGGMEESIAMLSDAHSHPVRQFWASQERSALFTLSQAAFYLLLVKLSIHFTRILEEVAR